MVVAVAGEFSTLSLIAYPANVLLPITRYLGFIWLMWAAVKLTRHNRPGHVVNVANAA
jgi:threonine/homoserine/homoserine lactone efflux protein